MEASKVQLQQKELTKQTAISLCKKHLACLLADIELGYDKGLLYKLYIMSFCTLVCVHMKTSIHVEELSNVRHNAPWKIIDDFRWNSWAVPCQQSKCTCMRILQMQFPHIFKEIISSNSKYAN